MRKTIHRCQYKKFKIKVIDSDREKGIWADFQRWSDGIFYGSYTDYRYTINEAIDAAKNDIDNWLSKN